MSFTWNYTLTDFLFENFNIDKVSTCVVITGAVFLTSLIVETIKYFELFLTKKLGQKLNFIKENANEDLLINEQSSLVKPLRIPSSLKLIKRQRLLLLFIKTILRMLTLFLAYIIMLIAMDYYVGHFLAIILGFGVGHYLLNSPGSDLEFRKLTNKTSIKLINDDKILSTGNRNQNNAGNIQNINYDEI